MDSSWTLHGLFMDRGFEEPWAFSWNLRLSRADTREADDRENTKELTSAGLEPATCGLEGRCSVQLSYEASV